MAEFVFARQFLTELAAFEKSSSSEDLRNLEKTLTSIASDPYLPGRVQSFYDPSSPSYLYRSGNIIVHYRVTQPGLIQFLNLFWSKM